MAREKEILSGNWERAKGRHARGEVPTQADIINNLFPVKKLQVYPNGVYRLVREQRQKFQRQKPERGKVRMFTKKSRERLAFTVNATRVSLMSMLTLTYPKTYPVDGKIVKRDLDAVRAKLRRAGLNYLWVLEFQARGAPHLHILTDSAGVTPRQRVDFGLYWTHRVVTSKWFILQCPPSEYHKHVMRAARFNTHVDVWSMLKNPEEGIAYVMAYAAKTAQKTCPPEFESVGRWWGCSNDVRPDQITEVPVTEDHIRQWLLDNGHPAYAWDVLPRTLWGVTP